MEDKAMQNFEFYAPTRMIFGKDTHKQVGKLVRSTVLRRFSFITAVQARRRAGFLILY